MSNCACRESLPACGGSVISALHGEKEAGTRNQPQVLRPARLVRTAGQDVCKRNSASTEDQESRRPQSCPLTDIHHTQISKYTFKK